VPVIASDHVHAASDLVRDGDDGVIIDAASAAEPDAWATAIAAVVDDGPWRAALSERGRVVGAAFACDHAAAFLLEVLAAAARQRSGGTGGAGGGVAARSFVAEGWQRIDAAADR
jgi:glycosyltransferase involved in cell wall biosynthesis